MIDFKKIKDDIRDTVQKLKGSIMDVMLFGVMKDNKEDFRFDYSAVRDSDMEMIIYFHCRKYEKYLHFSFVTESLIKIIDYHYTNRNENIDEVLSKNNYILLSKDTDVIKFIDSFLYDMCKEALNEKS